MATSETTGQCRAFNSRAARWPDNRTRKLELGGDLGLLVELIGIEPTTSGLQSPRSPS